MKEKLYSVVMIDPNDFSKGSLILRPDDRCLCQPINHNRAIEITQELNKLVKKNMTLEDKLDNLSAQLCGINEDIRLKSDYVKIVAENTEMQVKINSLNKEIKDLQDEVDFLLGAMKLSVG